MNNKIMNRGYDALVKEFKKPGNEFRGKPFWSWNGELEGKELKRQVDVLKEMGFGGYFMHSRTGLATEYLGDEWFNLCNEVADYGEKVDMESWLYDEDRWPSGSAGGIVTRDPKYRAKSIKLIEAKDGDTTPVDLLLFMFEAIIENGTEILKAYAPIKEGEKGKLTPKDGETKKILKFAIEYDAPNSNYNGTTYIDTMMLAATERFIELTHEEYKKRGGKRIGTTIKGIFTDEPHRGELLGRKRVDENGLMTCKICYTDDIFEEFEKRYGYDARPLLPEIFYKAPDFETACAVKHDYVDLADNLFVERFAMPINKWCIENNMDFTGHVLHENALTCQTVPQGSLMRFYEHMGAPGIDLLTEHDNSFWVAKQIQSAARQFDKKWVLSELYGCTGWQFNFKSHKAVGDWQALYGVNIRCPHLSWYTMEGEAKRDYPASILHQASYYKDYSFVEDYFARFGVVMTEGKPVCDVLVMNPIETVWTMIYAGFAQWIMPLDPEVGKVEKHYQDLFHIMRKAHVDFDYGEEQIMAENGSVVMTNEGPILKVGAMSYKTVVVSGLGTIRGTTVELLKKFSSLGGRVVVLGDAPYMVDCRKSTRFNDEVGYVKDDFSVEGVIRAVKPEEKIKVIIDCENDEIHYQLRDARDVDGIAMLALINTDRDAGRDKVRVSVSGLDNVRACAEWNMETGEITTVTGFSLDDQTIVLDFKMEAAGSKVFVFEFKNVNEKAPAVVLDGKKALSSITLSGEFDYELEEKNVCVLDYASAKYVGNDGKTGDFETQEILKLDWKIRNLIGIERRGGEMLQPWYAKKFANDEYGKLTLTYEFEIEKIPTKDIILAAERPDLNSYKINGEKLTPNGDFWIDTCMKTMPVSNKILKEGKNILTVDTMFKRTTNLECCFLVGDFGVKAKLLEKNRGVRWGDRGNHYDNNKVITDLPKKLTLENITDQNLLFYTGVVSYKVTKETLKEISASVKKTGGKAYLKVNDYVGSLSKVTSLDGKEKKVLAWEPYTVDVTDLLDEGFNFCLVCSRKNMFGPLHLNEAVPGAVGPDTFMVGGDGFTNDYVMMDSKPGEISISVI